MINRTRLMFFIWLVAAFSFLAPQRASAQERLCDPAFESCYGEIVEMIRNETVGIDMAFCL
jgi:hypothetical protein